MASVIRTMVSKDKYRYQQDGFDLDLTYITTRIIAMGLPGQGISGLWRNELEEVERFLISNHVGHYRIFNLSFEDTYNSSKLGDSNICFFGWPDHHPPSLDHLIKIVQAIDMWLHSHSDNVAVIHCKAGRGRTGTVICCYLIHLGMFTIAEDALEFFASRRSKILLGVTSPSQIRYTNYFARYKLQPKRKRIIKYLKKIVIKPVPDITGGVHPFVEILQTETIPFQVIYTKNCDTKTFQKRDFEITIDIGYKLQGDILIRIYNLSKVFGLVTPIMILRFSINLDFHPEDTIMFTREDMEGEYSGPLNDSRIPPHTYLQLLFINVDQSNSIPPPVDRSTKPLGYSPILMLEEEQQMEIVRDQ